MTKVLAVIPSNTFGGAHNQVVQLTRRLAQRGVVTDAALPREPGNATERLREAGVVVHRLRLRRPRARAPRSWLTYISGFPFQVLVLYRTIRESGADIVQAHGLLQLDVAVAARLARRPLVWQLLDTRPPRWLVSVVTPAMLRLSTVVMTTGTTTAAAYPPLRRTPRPVIAFYPPGQEMPSRSERLSGPVIFGCLANINPQKGYDFVIRSFVAAGLSSTAILRLRGAVTPGHERLRDELAELIRATGAQNIELQATATRPVDFLPDIDVLVLGSARRSEGTPTVILEAMEVGIPVIATRVGGVAELVEDGVSGFLVDPGDEERLAGRMNQLASDETLRLVMGTRGRDRAARSFSREATVEAYLRAFDLCLEAGSGGS